MSSISEEKFHGGAVAVSTDTALKMNSPRVVSCHNSLSVNVNLPPASSYRADQRGSVHFHVLAHGAGGVNVRTSTGSLLYSLSSGDSVSISLSSSGFKGVLRSIGAARPAHHAARDPITNPEYPLTFSGDCFVGDPCDLAEVNGNVPLDGEDGRDKCIVPMCQDVVAHAINQTREPIRASDIVMPKVVVVGFSRGQFVADSTHPLASTVLPDEFWEALYNNDRMHALIYVGSADGTSRHPHHLRWAGSSPTQTWEHGTGSADYSVKRHLWQKEVTYLNGEVEQTVLIVFCVEHTLSSEPGADPFTDPGGMQDRDHGAWGSLFSLYVFCDQLLPSFADGDGFTPAGASGNVSFTHDDPFVSGIAYGVGESEEDKFCHPQMVLCAHLPTTFQAPMGAEFIPWADRKWLRGWESGDFDLRGGNREFCHKVRNGSPWIDPISCTSEQYPRNTIDGLRDIFGNIAFGWSTSGYSSACMSLGGDFESSKPVEFLVWENGQGSGRTYLKPLKPGWDELCGSLDVEGGSSGTVAICVDDENGIDDGTGRRVWPRASLVECDGHPDEPFEGIGGGHGCFNNGNVSSSGVLVDCCISVGPPSTATVTDKCLNYTNEYGSFSSGSCEAFPMKCVVAGTNRLVSPVEYEDHTYLMNGNQDLRTISWVRLLPDPTYVVADYLHTGASSELIALHGTWDFSTGTVTGQGVVHASNVKAACVYAHAGTPVNTDAVVSAVSSNAKTVFQGLGGRMSEDGSGLDGYVGVLESTGGSNGTATIRKYVDNAETILSSKSITNFTSETVEFSLDVWGDQVTFSWTVSGEDGDSLEAEDCEISSGEFGLVTMDTGTSSSTLVAVDDETKNFLEIEGAHGRYYNSVSWDGGIPESRKTFRDDCDSLVVNPGCGTPPNCNCTYIYGASRYTNITSWDGVDITYPDGRDVLLPECSGPPDYTGDGENPTYSGGPLPRCDCDSTWCIGDIPRCGTCPEPWVTLSLSLPSCWPSQKRDEDSIIQPNMCSGVSLWSYDLVSCF